MENLSPAVVWAVILSGASAIVLILNAVEKVAKVTKAAKAPNAEQNKRLDDLEHEVEDINRKLSNDWARMALMDEGNRASQRALLALLDHGIDGNNIEQMEKAKEELQNHLINR